MTTKTRWITAAAVWAVAIGFGAYALIAYEGRAGAPAVRSADAAQGEGLPGSGPLLVLCLHPRCPCSQATLIEFSPLAKLAADQNIPARIVIVCPPGTTDDWHDTPLVRSAREIAGAAVELDRDGRLARRLGARTSGQSFLFDAAGREVFSGGITLARGHAGDNPGAQAVRELLDNSKQTGDQPAARRTAPVFGCALLDDESETCCAKGDQCR